MPRVQDLIDWIIAEGLSTDTIESILQGVAERLTDLGYPILRASIAMPSIDPLQRGASLAWYRSSGFLKEIQGHDEASQALFQRSPISYLLTHNLQYARWRLPPGPDAPPIPLLTELAELGATDYLMKIVSFPGDTALAGASFSIAVDNPGGFSDRLIADLEKIVPALSLACWRIATTRVATDVLAVYTGARTSGRILSGHIRRGDGTAIYAAILFADLKNFTSLNEKHEPDRIVGWLNQHFEAIGAPVEQQGGEILKFMGDSLLAIFPADVDNPAEACGRALSAARAAMDANAEVNRQRAQAEEPELMVDIVLHVGEVFYGNVGAARRLDFTAIGRAVNEATRMEKLADIAGHSLLASADFVLQAPGRFQEAGTFLLKGVARPATIYAWPD
ncbi:adenylate cyclase [Rhizobium sp. BK650]|uniref:adenylate/guanylate cyclase domain-containing protein n=1 Tax=Rhizobium sp. BK650 TaxID=2586990 RepID=UPI001619BAD2|nr:adenylate/guanylate cyclase domain-containing protein [Rhizobium sp. BK650]MBB3659324.1 adenylate cyclase [Rhizobium sp. BK650]